MAFLIHSPEISTVSAKVFSTTNPNPKFLKTTLSISRNDEKVRSTARINASLKDFAGSWDQNVRLYGLYSAPVKQGSKQRKEKEEEKQNYYVNMGYAIRTLREDFPDLFYRELGFDIYRFEFDPLSLFACFTELLDDSWSVLLQLLLNLMHKF